MQRSRIACRDTRSFGKRPQDLSRVHCRARSIHSFVLPKKPSYTLLRRAAPLFSISTFFARAITASHSLTVDRGGNMGFFNPSIVSLVGLPMSQKLDRKARFLATFRVAPKDAEGCQCERLRANKGASMINAPHKAQRLHGRSTLVHQTEAWKEKKNGRSALVHETEA